MPSERHVCTADDPWTGSFLTGASYAGDAGYKGKAVHPDANEVSGTQRDNYPCGDLVDYLCPHCRIRFTIELPQ